MKLIQLSRVRYAAIISLISLFYSCLHAQNLEEKPGIEIKTGTGILIYQSAFAVDNFLGIEVAVQGGMSSSLRWQAGTRMWFDPLTPEAFIRILFTERIGAWSPAAGIEIGATGSPVFSEGSQLLRETRNAMRKDAGPMYISSYISPLSFSFGHGWNLSVAEINFGTHFKNMGRTLRLYVNVIAIAKTI